MGRRGKGQELLGRRVNIRLKPTSKRTLKRGDNTISMEGSKKTYGVWFRRIAGKQASNRCQKSQIGSRSKRYIVASSLRRGRNGGGSGCNST